MGLIFEGASTGSPTRGKESRVYPCRLLGLLLLFESSFHVLQGGKESSTPDPPASTSLGLALGMGAVTPSSFRNGKEGLFPS